MAKEASARIRINKLLEEAGWRFFPDGDKPANIQLESTVVKIGDVVPLLKILVRSRVRCVYDKCSG